MSDIVIGEAGDEGRWSMLLLLYYTIITSVIIAVIYPICNSVLISVVVVVVWLVLV